MLMYSVLLLLSCVCVCVCVCVSVFVVQGQSCGVVRDTERSSRSQKQVLVQMIALCEHCVKNPFCDQDIQ